MAFFKRMQKGQKITAILPPELLKRARKATGLGITPTIKRGLELVAANDAYEGILKLGGKLDLGIDLKALREDRKL